MAWSLGHILIVILALLLGLAAGWLLRGARTRDVRTNPTAAGDGDIPESANVPTVESTPAISTVVETSTTESTTEETSPADGPVESSEPAASPAAESSSAPEVNATPDKVEPAATTAAIPNQRIAEPAPDTPTETEAATVTVTETEPGAADNGMPESVTTDEPEPEAVPAAEAVSSDETPAPTVKPTADADAGTEADADDDLQQIQGIGPKLAAALNGAGIRTYRQLAETEVEALRTTLRAAGMRLPAGLPTWPRQARLLTDNAIDPAAASTTTADEAKA